jgi:hypothetical protein
MRGNLPPSALSSVRILVLIVIKYVDKDMWLSKPALSRKHGDNSLRRWGISPAHLHPSTGRHLPQAVMPTFLT